MKVFARVSALFAFVAVLAVGAASSPAASPPAGSIGPPNGTSFPWAGQPYAVGHSVAVPDACPPAIDPGNVLCDHFLLTVNVPASYWDTHTGGADIQITWGSPDDDFDLYVYNKNREPCRPVRRGGWNRPRSASSSRERTAAGNGTEVRVVPLPHRGCDLQRTRRRSSPQDGGPAPNPPRTTGGLTFAPPTTIVDAQRTEGEPLNYIDRFGHYWDSGPYGFSTGQSWSPVDRRRRAVQHRQLRRPPAERAARRR